MFLTHLPPEIRYRIYRLLLISPTQITNRRCPIDFKILLVCRQIYQEAWYLPYRYNEFYLGAENILGFLSLLLPRQRQEIRRLHLNRWPIFRAHNIWHILRACKSLSYFKIDVDLGASFMPGLPGEDSAFRLNGLSEVSIEGYIREVCQCRPRYVQGEIRTEYADRLRAAWLSPRTPCDDDLLVPRSQNLSVGVSPQQHQAGASTA